MQRTCNFGSLPLFTRLPLILFLVCYVCFSGSCQHGPQAPRAQEVVLRLDWIAYGTHAPFFLALDKGYYRDYGIDLKIVEGKGSATTVQIIASGSETFGFADAGTAMKAATNGAPVKVVLGILQTSPMCVISLAESGILEPRDLVGKSIALTPGDSLSQIFPALLKANGVGLEEVNIVSTDPAGKTSALLSRRVDAMSGYMVNQAATIRATGASINVMKYADFGVNTLSNGIIVNTKTLEEDPKLVKNFVQATLRGLEYAQEYPKEAIQSLLTRFPDLDRQVVSEQLSATFILLRTPNTTGHPLGWQSEQDWRNTQELLFQYGGLEKKLPVDTFFTNAFLP